jgi:hypothetical protein
MPTLITNPAAQYSVRVPPIDVCTQEEFFEYQVEKLVSLKLARYEDADGLRKELPESGLFDFMPTAPKEIDLKATMALVDLDYRKGVSYLDHQYHTDLEQNPAKPSLLVDVEDGRGRLNVAPMFSRVAIVKGRRHPFTTWRGLIHVILFPDVLKHHYIDLIGSWYYERRGVPFLYLDDDKPALDGSRWEGAADQRWGAASCGRIIVC